MQLQVQRYLHELAAKELTRANRREVLSDMDFPSGPWTGFYNCGRNARRHRMDLVLTFADHTVSGDGSDDVGQFGVTGGFDESNGECYWIKTYLGGHDVHYRGFREGKGIWGLWDLPNESGGFHIWPLGQGEGDQIHRSAEEPAFVGARVV